MVDPRPEARAALNSRAEELLSKVRPFTIEEISLPKPTFEPDIAVAGHITDEDIKGPVVREEFDPATGNFSRILATTVSGVIGLRGDDCNLLDSLVSQAIKCCKIGRFVSADFVRNFVKEWLFLKPEETRPDFTQALIGKVKATVIDLEVMIPIAFLNIETEFKLGMINFRTITRELLDEWHERTRAFAQTSDRDQLENYLRRERQELQGLAMASLTLEAEPSHAISQTLELAENTLSYLNFFHVANHFPRLICHTRLLGQEYVPRYKAFAQKPNGGKITKSSLVLPPPEPWVISSARLSTFRQAGLVKLHELLSLEAEDRSDFQNKLLEVLLIYSRNSLAREPVEKLIYILVALESMLLKDPQEPIQQNIGERLAFAVGSSGANRQEIAALVKTCYNFRSKYLHHGFNMSSLDEIRRLMEYAWLFFRSLILRHQHFNSKQALLDTLDERKFA